MKNSTSSSPVLAIALAERERRMRQRLRAEQSSVADLISRARVGDWRPLFSFQWPSIRLDDFQTEILDAVFDPTVWGVFVKGNTGCGKSAVGGMAASLYFATWDDARAILTSATSDHAKAVLFGETATWFQRMRLPPAAFVGREGIIDNERPTERHIEVVNPENDEAFSGRHGAHVLFMFDEATAIADSRFKMARTQATKFLAFANPRTMFGFFRKTFPAGAPNKNQTILTLYGKCRFQTIDGETILNVRERRLDKPLGPPGGITIDGRTYVQGEPIPPASYDKVRPLIPGQVCYDTFEALKQETDRRWVGVFCHARFPDEDPDKQVILAAWLERSYELWGRWRRAVDRCRRQHSLLANRLLQKWFPLEAFGLDVAASAHGDETILAAGGKRGVLGINATRYADTMETCGWVLRTAQSEWGVDLRRGEHPVGIDVDGLGKGVADRLREQGVRVVECRGNDPSTVDPKRYFNKRAERYAELGHRLNPDGKHGSDVYLMPDDDFLSQELTAVEREFSGSDGLRFRVTPKTKPPGSEYNGPTIRDKIGRSPDRADAVCYLWEALSGCGNSLERWLELGAF